MRAIIQEVVSAKSIAANAVRFQCTDGGAAPTLAHQTTYANDSIYGTIYAERKPTMRKLSVTLGGIWALIVTILLLPVLIVIYTVGAIKRLRQPKEDYNYHSGCW